MSGFATVAKNVGQGAGGANTANAASTTQFGETLVAQLVPAAQAIFSHGISTINFVTSSVGSGASVTSANGLATLTSGLASSGSASLQLKRALSYRAGEGSVCRMTALFGTPVADNYQLVGLGNIESGYFFGYQGTIFGVMHITDGAREIRKLTVSAGVANGTSVTITLSGESRTFTINGGSSINQTSWEISQQDYSNMAGGWVTEAYDGTIYFISMHAQPEAGVYSATGTGLTATFSQVVVGATPTINFVSQSAWNIDPMNGNGPSRFNIDPTKGNVYQIGFQYLGFGNARFAIEDSNTGQFQTVHMFKQANARSSPVLKDPHLNAKWQTFNSGSTTAVSLKGASISLFTEGNVTRNVGPAFSTSTSSTDVDSIEKVFLTIRADRIFNNRTAHTEIFLSSLTVSPITTGNHFMTAKIYKNLRLSGPVNFVEVNASQSFCSVDKAATGFSLNNSTLLGTYVVKAGNVLQIDLKGEGFYAAAGETISVTLTSSSDNQDCAVSLTWFEDQ